MSRVSDELIERAHQITRQRFNETAKRLGTEDIVFLVTFKENPDIRDVDPLLVETARQVGATDEEILDPLSGCVEPEVQAFPRADWQKMIGQKHRYATETPVEGGWYVAVVEPGGSLQVIRVFSVDRQAHDA